MKRSSAIVAVTLVCVLCLFLSGCGIDAPFAGSKPDPTRAPTSSVIGAATTAAGTAAAPYTTAPYTTVPAAPSSTAAPASTAPASTPAPASQTPVVSETGANVPPTAAPASSQSGKPAPIQLRLGFGGEPMGDDSFILTVDVILDCYDISIGSAKKGSVTVNGVTKNFVTQGFTLDSPGRNSLVLHTETFLVSLENTGSDSVTVSAEWYFKGSYGGEKIDVLTAQETIDVRL